MSDDTSGGRSPAERARRLRERIRLADHQYYVLAQPELSFLTAAVAILILGIAAGVEFDVLAYLASRYFGLRHYATIYGILYAFFGFGAGVGPAVFGMAFEATGSYDLILLIASGAFLIGALPLLLLGPYRRFG